MISDILTYSDMIDQISRWSRHTRSVTAEDIRYVVHAAYRELINSHDWTFLKRHGRIVTGAAVTDATLTYDHTGGTYERECTIAGDTWPTDAWNWRIRIGDTTICEIAEYKSATVVTLDENLNPGQDVDAGTSFTLYKSTYPLPLDFQSMEATWGESAWRIGTYIEPEDWMALERNNSKLGSIEHHTIMGSPDHLGSMILGIWPAESAVKTIDFMYHRRPRQLRYSGHDTNDKVGTVATTADSTAVVGTTTAFSSGMVGSVIRISPTGDTTLPTGRDGINAFDEERSIAAVTDTTSLTLDNVASASRTGSGYRITDPIDLESTMFNAFLACCRKQLATLTGAENTRNFVASYNEALHYAKCGDQRSTERVVMGQQPAFWRRLADRSSAVTDTE